MEINSDLDSGALTRSSTPKLIQTLFVQPTLVCMTLLEASRDLENLRRLASDFRVCGFFEEAHSLSEVILGIPSYSPRSPSSLPSPLSDLEQSASDLINLRYYARAVELLKSECSEIAFCMTMNALLLQLQQDRILLPAKEINTISLRGYMSRGSTSMGSIACYVLGNACNLLGDVIKATEWYRAAVASNPLNIAALSHLEVASSSWVNKFSNAMKGVSDIDEIAQDFPGIRKLQLNLAASLSRDKAEKKLVEIFSKGLEGFLEGASAYGHLLFVQKKQSELSELASECFEIDRCSPETLKVVADHFAIQGLREKAVLALRKASQVTPEDAGVWVLLGHAFLELRNLPAAIHAYSKAMEIEPDEPSALRSLGMAYDLLGQKSFAQYYQNRADCLKKE